MPLFFFSHSLVPFSFSFQSDRLWDGSFHKAGIKQLAKETQKVVQKVLEQLVDQVDDIEV